MPRIAEAECATCHYIYPKMRIPGSSRAVFRFDRAHDSDVMARSVPI